MMAKLVLPAVAGLLFLAAGAQAETGGGSASVHRLPDGHTVISLNGRTKTCKPGQIPLATGARTTIVTEKRTKTYPKGLLACLDPKPFGGAATVSIEGDGVLVKPAPTSKP
ncbi:MAG: hypothetical protein JF571_10890 [Asticcacaulis sp.]|nr:hypothetical protein [Asticcacaulis sp.]